MIAPALTFQGQITRPDLAALLDAAGSTSLLSPRALLGPAALQLPKLSPAFVGAVQVLAAPRTNLTLRLWGDEEASAETNVLFPELPGGGGGVTLNAVGAEFQIAGFVEPEGLLDLLTPVLPPQPTANPPAFEAQLECKVMAVFAACLDLLCEAIVRKRVARVLDQRPLPAHVLADAPLLARSHIRAYLQSMWGLSKFNQFITYVLPLSVMAAPPGDADIDAALDVLRSAGLFDEPRRDRLQATVLLEPVVAALLGASAGLQWQRISLLEDDALLVVERLFVLGAAGIVFSLSPTADNILRFALCSRRDMVDFFTGELSGGIELWNSASQPSMSQQSPSPAATSSPSLIANVARYCGQCGAAREPAWKYCGTCGATLPVWPKN